MKTIRALLATTVLAATVLAGQPAAADVRPPPTGVIDFLWLGPVGATVAGLLLVAGVVLLFRWLRRRGRGRLFATAMAVGLFVVGNLACYVLAVSVFRPARPDHRPVPPPATADVTRAPGP